MTEIQNEKLVDRQVTYTLEMEGRFYIVENVPARIDEQTGEQFFAPSTVEHLRETILKKAGEPKRYEKTPVYDYAE